MPKDLTGSCSELEGRLKKRLGVHPEEGGVREEKIEAEPLYKYALNWQEWYWFCYRNHYGRTRPKSHGGSYGFSAYQAAEATLKLLTDGIIDGIIKSIHNTLGPQSTGMGDDCLAGTVCWLANCLKRCWIKPRPIRECPEVISDLVGSLIATVLQTPPAVVGRSLQCCFTSGGLAGSEELARLHALSSLFSCDPEKASVYLPDGDNRRISDDLVLGKLLPRTEKQAKVKLFRRWKKREDSLNYGLTRVAKMILGGSSSRLVADALEVDEDDIEKLVDAVWVRYSWLFFAAMPGGKKRLNRDGLCDRDINQIRECIWEGDADDVICDVVNDRVTPNRLRKLAAIVSLGHQRDLRAIATGIWNGDGCLAESIVAVAWSALEGSRNEMICARTNAERGEDANMRRLLSWMASGQKWKAGVEQKYVAEVFRGGHVDLQECWRRESGCEDYDHWLEWEECEGLRAGYADRRGCAARRKIELADDIVKCFRASEPAKEIESAIGKLYPQDPEARQTMRDQLTEIIHRCTTREMARGVWEVWEDRENSGKVRAKGVNLAVQRVGNVVGALAAVLGELTAAGEQDDLVGQIEKKVRCKLRGRVNRRKYLLVIWNAMLGHGLDEVGEKADVNPHDVRPCLSYAAAAKSRGQGSWLARRRALFVLADHWERVPGMGE